MRTPIADFVKQYKESGTSRLHMPGHKGCTLLGCEDYDITEITGADSLYEADGIIAESERNATDLFGTGRTVFSTEGSSQCIRAMLYLAINNRESTGRPYVIAGRNAHKAFLYVAAVLDFDIVWLWPKEMHSLCSCLISEEQLEQKLSEEIQKRGEVPVAVYLTSPDYLGGRLAIKEMAEVCHRYDTILAVDNAHGAYLRFLQESQHPIDLGADICCDSAHKTLPVLTGGAYLHISENAPEYFREYAKSAMALFGSTSPSYLTLMSLDLCNAYLSGDYRERLKHTVERLKNIRRDMRVNGWQVEETDPLKLTIKAPVGMTGKDLAQKLRLARIECEYADEEYLVLMATPENKAEDYERLMNTLGICKETCGTESTVTKSELAQQELLDGARIKMHPASCRQQLSVREAMFAKQETIATGDSLGRICGAPTVACPPAIPIVVSGEVIDENAIVLFAHYGIDTVSVVLE